MPTRQEIERGRLLAPLAAAVALGWIEWAAIGRLGFGRPQEEAMRTLLALLLVYGLVGLICVIAAAGLRFKQGRAVALPMGVLGGTALLLKGTSPLLIVAACGLAWAVSEAGLRFNQRYRVWMIARTWWIVAAAGALLALLLSLFQAPDNMGLLVALGAGIVAAALILATRSVRSASPAILSLICVLGGALFLASRATPVETAADPDPQAPAVLFITVDTLRADHVGAYGHEQARTPNLDALAREGVLFRQAIAPSPFTGPSHVSIMTGLLPENHGATINGVKVRRETRTLADAFRKAGYATSAFVSGFTTIDGSCGLPSRFDEYDDQLSEFRLLPWRAYRMTLLRALRAEMTSRGIEFAPIYRVGRETTDLAVEWIERNGERPFFVWLHLFDPHLPYKPPATFVEPAKDVETSDVTGRWYGLSAEQRFRITESPARLARMLELYDAEIAYADQQLGRAIEAARRHAPPGGLLIVATADHGEPMGEHNLYWFRDLFDPTIQVPLIVVPPSPDPSLQQSVVGQVRSIDIAPTVLDMLGLPAWSDLDGVSLTGLMRGDESRRPGPAFSAIYPDRNEPQQQRFAVRADGWKLIQRNLSWVGRERMLAGTELYDLRSDPAEERNVVHTQPPSLEPLREEMLRHAEIDAVELTLTPEQREALKSLGYVN